MARVSQGCLALTGFVVEQSGASGKPDWDRVLRIALAHEIAPYMYRGVVDGPYAEVPPRILERLEREHEASTRRNRVLRDECLVVLKRLRAAGIEVLPYKEALTFSLSNPDIGMRRFKDVDFLVDVDDLAGILVVLEGLGYETEKPAKDYLAPGFQHLDKDCSFLRKSAWTTGRAVPGSIDGMRKHGFMILEPHWSLTHPRLNIDLPLRALRERMRALEYEGERIGVLSPEDELLVACIVGGKSEWRSLKPVADVVAAIENAPDLDWDACLERATRARARRMFLLGCLLASQIAATPVPEAVTRAALREGPLPGLARDVRRDFADASAPTRVDPRRFSLRMLRQRERRRDRLRYAIDTLTAPGSQELRLLPLPRALRFAYRLLVPFTRYLAIPVGRRLRDVARRGPGKERRPTAG